MVVEMHKNWVCPNCHKTHQSVGSKTAMHFCPALNNLFIPMVIEGSDCINKVNYREDYVKGDLVTATHHGKVVSSVSTEHADGSNGLTVFVPCAVTKIEKPEN